MDTEEVEEYVGHAQAIIGDSPQMDEANTKAAILRDFLGLLGWKIPANTQLEYSVNAFGKTYKVDYALVLEGTPVAFIEAKGVDTSLTDSHREKLEAYLKNEDVNLGILTNGEEYEFYRRRVVDSKVKVNTLAEIQLQELPERVTILEAFTKTAIQNDEWEKILDRIQKLKVARSQLEQRKEEVATEVVETVTDNVSEVVSSHAESQAKEMIDRVIQDLEREISVNNNPTIETSDPRRRNTQGEDTAVGIDSDENYKTDHPWDESGRYIVKITEDGDEIAKISGDNQSEAMVNVTDYFIARHDLIGEIEIPWVPSRNKAILNDEPEWERADPAYKAVSDGYYLDVKLNKAGKRREIRRMADRVGLDVEFEGDW